MPQVPQERSPSCNNKSKIKKCRRTRGCCKKKYYPTPGRNPFKMEGTRGGRGGGGGQAGGGGLSHSPAKQICIFRMDHLLNGHVARALCLQKLQNVI